MRVGSATNRLVSLFNRGVTGLLWTPLVGPLVGRRLTTITYQGRRSGRTFTTPVEYRRTGDVVTIGVQFPDAKNWWRNFTDDGGPVTLQLDGAPHAGHATARRGGPYPVTVTVELDPPD